VFKTIKLSEAAQLAPARLLPVTLASTWTALSGSKAADWETEVAVGMVVGLGLGVGLSANIGSSAIGVRRSGVWVGESTVKEVIGVGNVGAGALQAVRRVNKLKTTKMVVVRAGGMISLPSALVG
jgi:hypothetical protein